MNLPVALAVEFVKSMKFGDVEVKSGTLPTSG